MSNKQISNGHGSADFDKNVSAMADAYRSILQSVGEDPSREGLLKTPERAAKALLYFTKGYNESLTGNGIGLVIASVMNFAQFQT